MDCYSDYLNCQNGIVNLRTGELIPHDSNFMMSNICYAEYNPNAEPPKMWLQFLDDVTNGDKDLQEYLQKCVGYSLTGSIREQCAFFLYGLGNNGKSTFLDTISDLLGTYGGNVQPETIMMRKNSDGGANSDIARLRSKRFVTTVEPNEGVRLNEGLVKQLTGGDKVTCRFLYGDEFEYSPEYKIWMGTNHKPVIRGTDTGIWRRIRLIPFEVNIPKEKVDKNLKYKLRKELPQIFKWAVDGCIKWQKEGLEPPKVVEDATKEYKVEMDILASFVDACIEIDYVNGKVIPAQDLFEIYVAWAKKNNEFEMTSSKFFREITKKLPEKARRASGIVYPKIKETEYAQSLLKTGYSKNYSISDFKS
jgi:putative DNA primase/helicase